MRPSTPGPACVVHRVVVRVVVVVVRHDWFVQIFKLFGQPGGNDPDPTVYFQYVVKKRVTVSTTSTRYYGGTAIDQS